MRIPRALDTLLWLPLNLLQALFTIVWTAALIALALVVSALSGPGAALAMARRAWAPGLLVGAGATLRIDGLDRIEPSRPYLVVANHQSWIDIPALFRAFPGPLRFVAKRELARVPFLGAYIRAMGMVVIDRSARRGAKGSVERATDVLAAGASLVSFPEGTRSRDGRLGRFKSGGFQAALDAGAAVLPVAIVNAGAVLPAGGFRVRPGRIELRIGRPIDLRATAFSSRSELARAAERAVAELLGEPAPNATRRVEEESGESDDEP